MIRLPKRWYHVVKSDVTKLPDALEWYMDELDKGFKDIEITGNIEALNQVHPGLVVFFDAMHTDLDMMLEHFERQLRMMRGARIRKWADDPPTNAKVGVNDTKIMVDSEKDISDFADLVEEIKYVYKQYGSLLKSLDSRGFSLSNIVRLRIANMEEVEV